jgi:hypothetical protein
MTRTRRRTPVPAEDVGHLLSSLEPHLQRCYPELRDLDPHLRLRHQRIHRWSCQVILEVRGRDGPTGHVLLAKLPFERDPTRPSTGEVRPPADGESFELEYEALRAIWNRVRACPSAEFTAIRPIHFVPKLNAVVMEFLPDSRSLLALTREAAVPWVGRRRLRAATEAARSGGKLLRFLHDELTARAPEKAPLDEAAYRSLLARRLDMVMGSGVAAETLESRRARILSRLGEVDEDVRVTLVHGDLYPGNVIRSARGQVCVVDATLHRRAPGVEDIAKLCVGLETMKPAVLGPFVQRGALRAVRDAFVSSYFGPESVPVKPLRCFEILALLRRWYEIRDVVRKTWGSIGPLTSLVTRRVDSYMLERLDRWIADL